MPEKKFEITSEGLASRLRVYVIPKDDSSSTEQVSSTSESYDEPVSSNSASASLLKLLLSNRLTIIMQLLRLFTIFSVLLVSGLGAPVDTARKDTPSSSSDGSKTPPASREHGEFVGVRPGAYEKKTKENNLKSISIHPGVVMGGPHPETGRYSVAMISKKLPNDPPQAPIEHYHPVSTVYGNIALSPPKEIRPEDMKGWINEKTGAREKHMNDENLTRLKKDMGPHVDWRPPTPPPKPPTPPPKTPPPPPAKTPKNAKKGQQNNAHASGSQHTSPSRHGGTGHPTPFKHGAAGHGHPGTPGSPSTHGSGSRRHSTTGGPNQQHGKAPRRSSSPDNHPHAQKAPKRSSSPDKHPHAKAPRRSSSPDTHPHAKKAPRRSSAPGPRPKSPNHGKKPAHGGGTKPSQDHSHKHKR
ncbi:hypothetical protein CVT25_009214 [Psilocybe cyanescens]|uniref:Uncharacterized protein n=1 Tax=Psilocybe cyanescens TaxID=93625 RepID=A0A409WWJ5_PSICY|nr:hypothetical protein CVT25_009214 [Psilocybe cyanescens]